MKEKKSYNTIYVYRLITRKEIGGIREKERNCAMKKENFLFSYFKNNLKRGHHGFEIIILLRMNIIFFLYFCQYRSCMYKRCM